MVRMGLLGVVVGVLYLAGVASAGSTLGCVNETMADDGLRGGGGRNNRGALRDLMSSGKSERQGRETGGTVEECVESVGRMRQFYNTEVPPGAQEWCECIVADPPTTVPSAGGEESRADWDRTFDRCRALVLDGSDFNTVDICRGMFQFFSGDARIYYHSFCGKLCSPLDPPGDAMSYYFFYRFNTIAFDLDHTCDSECAKEAMPGYCSKYTLTYSSFNSFRSGISYSVSSRDVVVNYEKVARQVIGSFSGKRADAQAICGALQPLLGCYNACCNYSRGFRAMNICCSTEENGKAVFNCSNNFGGSNLFIDCVAGFDSFFDQYVFSGDCRPVVEKYMEGPDYGTAKLFTRISDGKVVIMFPESTIEELGGCDYFYSSYFQIDFLANCMDPLGLMYKGPAVPTLSGPLEPADCGDKPEEDPCLGTCGEDRQCVLASNGKPFCVECSALLKKDEECCSYDEEKMRCVTALKNSPLGKCKRNNKLFVVDDEGDRVPATFLRSTGFACGNPREFRMNGKACKVLVNANGVATCFEKK